MCIACAICCCRVAAMLQGVHKILKKHDKLLPHAPCRQFYIAHLHQQPWVQGTYSDVLVHLSNVYSQLRGDSTGQKNEDAAQASPPSHLSLLLWKETALSARRCCRPVVKKTPPASAPHLLLQILNSISLAPANPEPPLIFGLQGFVRSTTKYWVRAEDVSNVKYHILQHLPVFQFDKDDFSGDAQLINSVYFDNENLELYHGRLDKKPNAIALRIRWGGSMSRGACVLRGGSACCDALFARSRCIGCGVCKCWWSGLANHPAECKVQAGQAVCRSCSLSACLLLAACLWQHFLFGTVGGDTHELCYEL